MTRRIWIEFQDQEARERARGLIPVVVDAVDNGSKGIDVELDNLQVVLRALDEDGFHFHVEVSS